jgi:hypothetical protein
MLDNVKIATIADHNPGAIRVLTALCDYECECDNICDAWIAQRIIGVRLWYLYKNVFKYDIGAMARADLTPYDDVYFYKKIERYM